MTALPPDDEMPSTELAPIRLIDGGAGERERRLIASAQLDRTPSGAKARVAAALGGVLEPNESPSIPAPAAPERAASGALRSRSGARWSVGIVGAGVLGAIALTLWLSASPGAKNADSTPSGRALEPSDAPSRHSPAALPPAELPQQADLTQPNLVRPDPLPQSVAPRSQRSRPQRPFKQGVVTHGAPDAGLLAEVRALEAVSSALGAGHAERAARELDAYRRRFARGELAIEADVLAIQIAIARGDDEVARASAERLLALPEAEHYRARVRALLASERDDSAPSNPENEERPRSNGAAAHMKARR
jgi:hypothetical protein